MTTDFRKHQIQIRRAQRLGRRRGRGPRLYVFYVDVRCPDGTELVVGCFSRRPDAAETYDEIVAWARQQIDDRSSQAA